MAFIIFDHPVQMPVGELVKRLKEAFPRFGWTVGDGAQTGLAELTRPSSIIGRTPEGEMVLMGIEQGVGPLPLAEGAPPHQHFIKLTGPSIESEDFASRMLLVVAGVFVWSAQRGHFQRMPGGPWFGPDVVAEGLQHCVVDANRGGFNAFQFLAASAGAGSSPRNPAETLMMEADLEHGFAAAVAQVMGPENAARMGYAAPPSYAEEEPRADRLPTFVIALERPLEFDWSALADVAQFDPEGSWTIEPGPGGTGTLRGRGCAITIAADPQPIPGYVLKNALARSFWFKDTAALERRAQSLVVTCDLDTRAAPYEAVRETAKLITLVLGLITREPGALALLNKGINTLLDPAMVQSQVGHLHKNQVPLMMWTWTAPNSMERDNVSLTSGGLLPFLGYEVEVWNAPGDAHWVGEKMSHILNYLLHVGPIVKEGESFGETPGERSVRAFFGQTKAQRYDSDVPVMFLEFDNPSGIEQPRPDAVPSGQPTEGANGPLTDAFSLIARTRESAFPSASVIEQLERNLPEYRWAIAPGQPGRTPSHRISGEGPAGRVQALVTEHDRSIPRRLNPPPHRFAIDVAVGTGGDRALAARVALVICCCAIIQVDPEAHFLLGPGGNWLTHDDALTGVSAARHLKDVGEFDRHFGIAPERFAEIDPSLPGALPPMPDELASAYLSIAPPRRSERAAPAPPPPPRPGMFGRKGVFGRKQS